MSKGKKVLITMLTLIVLLLVGAILYYTIGLQPVNKNGEEVIVTIDEGSTVDNISQVLKEAKVIRSANIFNIYCRLNNVSDMKAGIYTLNKNMSMEAIIADLKEGNTSNPYAITITFLEGKNMRWIAKTIAENTQNSEDDVYNKLTDEEYLNTLIDKYWFITDEVKNSEIYYSLEGYLFPDTYEFQNSEVTVEEILTSLLNQMENHLEKYKETIQSNNISVHKILTMASIVELEASNDSDRAGVASVFYNRLKNGMTLGSDVTTYYAAKVDVSERDLKQSEINASNAYNTRNASLAGKLPAGPIATVGDSSIDAAINPEETNYLFFVADKNGKIYYAETDEEHTKNITYLKNQGLWFLYED